MSGSWAEALYQSVTSVNPEAPPPPPLPLRPPSGRTPGALWGFTGCLGSKQRWQEGWPTPCPGWGERLPRVALLVTHAFWDQPCPWGGTFQEGPPLAPSALCRFPHLGHTRPGPAKGWSAPRWEGSLAGTGGTFFSWMVKRPVHHGRRAPHTALCIRKHGGHPPPFSDPSPERSISGQPPKPTPGLSPSLPLGPLIRSATVLMRVPSKQTGEEGSACSREGGLARGWTPQRGSRCSREGPPVGVLIRASELEGLHPHVPRLWGHESPPLWLSMEPAVDAAGTKRDRCQLLRRRVPVPGGAGAGPGNPGGAPTEPPQLPSALPVASDCFWKTLASLLPHSCPRLSLGCPGGPPNWAPRLPPAPRTTVHIAVGTFGVSEAPGLNCLQDRWQNEGDVEE